MSEKRHAAVSNSTNIALAKEYSLQLDDGLPSLFGRNRGLSGLPTSYQGAFPKALVNEYGSHSICEGETRLEKWTSLSNIVPSGVLLEKQDTVPASSSQQAKQLPPCSQHLLRHNCADQLHQQKQAIQQRGPGRPDHQHAGSMSSLGEAHPQLSFQRKTGPVAKLSQAPDKTCELSGIPAAVLGKGKTPFTQSSSKKTLKFKVKLNGRVVSPSPAPEAESNVLVDLMCGLGQEQLLSPLPSDWSRIMSTTAQSAPISGATEGVPTWQSGQPSTQAGAAPDCGKLLGPCTDAGQERGVPGWAQAELRTRGGRQGRTDLEKSAPSGKMDSPFGAADVQSFAEAVDGAAGVVGGSAPLLSPQPAGEGDMVHAKAGLLAGGSARDAQEPQENPSWTPLDVPDSRQETGSDQHTATVQTGKKRCPGTSMLYGSGELGEQHGRKQHVLEAGDVPAAKRPRSASAEPCRAELKHSQAAAGVCTPAAAALTKQKRGSSCELPSAQPSQPAPIMPASACRGAGPAAAAALGNSQRVACPSSLPPLASGDHHCTAAAIAGPCSGAERPEQLPAKQKIPAVTDDSSPLGSVAAPLHKVLQASSRRTVPAPSGGVQQLLDEGRRLKRFAEKRMQKNKHTHVSCTFLLSSALKFLAASGLMEQNPSRHSRDSVSSMFSQTAAMLEACSHSASRAEGPQLGTQVVALLAERLGAVARLRAVHCLRNELSRSAAAFRTAVESARGETFQRPSPTDSSVSATLSIPLDGGSPGAGSGGKGGLKKGGGQGGGGGGGGSATASPSCRGSAKKGQGGGGVMEETSGSAPAAGGQCLGLPRGAVDGELGTASHMQGVLAALAALSRSSQRIRDYMGKAAAEGNVHALRAAAGAALLSADGGMGDMEPVLQLGREALDSAMKIEA